LAAAVVKHQGAHYLEVKPVYAPEYSFESDVFLKLLPELRVQIERCRELEDDTFRVLLNNQLRDFLAGRVVASRMTTVPKERPCITNRLRLVVSPRGCYLCTPYRGRADKSIGDPRTHSLVDLWYSARHQRLMTTPCGLRCTYHEQNEFLLRLKAAGERPPAPEEQPSSQHAQASFL
jgi:hypothetical protein